MTRQSIRFGVLGLLSALFFTSVSAQKIHFPKTRTEDVLYLKNGWILRGKLQTITPEGRIAIVSRDRNSFSFDMSEVERVQMDTAIGRKGKTKSTYFFSEEKIVYHITAATTPHGSFQVLHPLNRQVWVGAGVGISEYNANWMNDYGLLVMPVFATARLHLRPNTRYMPFLYGSVGYGKPLFRNSHPENTDWAKGGAFFDGGIGVQKHTRHKLAFTLSISERYQAFEHYYVNTSPIWGWQQTPAGQTIGLVGWSATPTIAWYTFARPAVNVGIIF